MISKELFCKIIALIKEQNNKDKEFTYALEKMGSGLFLFGTENKYLEALLMLLQDCMNDKHDYIGWWLFEVNSDHKLWSEDESKEWTIETPEDLYDFIVNETQNES